MAIHSDAKAGQFKVGVDIGGTFTDLVFLLPSGEMRKLKVPSSPHDYSEAIVSGIATFCKTDAVHTEKIAEVVHATTVATNAILERKGARTALITTEGFKDVLELRRIRIPASYDLSWVKPAPLVDRRSRFEVSERVLADGTVKTALDIDTVRELADLLSAQGYEAIAVCLLHAYRYPEHETQIGKIIRDLLPQTSVTLSHEVLPEMLEFERTSTTVVNAYVMPLIDRYLKTLRASLDGLGVRAPVLVMQSNGGLISSNAARARPVSIIESGPAAGVIGALRVAKECGYSDVLTLDMGGTTTKASIIENGELLRATEYEVGSAVSISSRLMRGNGYVLRIPVIDISEVGAGGGSIAAIDAGGALRVGPHSAGAYPGPACYGLGNDQCTVTDANVVLGYLAEGSLAGGSVEIIGDLSRAVIQDNICAKSNLDLMQAAYGVHLVATSNMVRAIKTVSVERGRDPVDFVLMVFGGAGPIHAALVARELGIRTVVIPPAPGVFSAFGLLRADIEQHASCTVLMRTADWNVDGVGVALQKMSDNLHAALIEEGCEAEHIEVRFFADVRYRGQSSEITVALPTNADLVIDFAALEVRFDEEFEQTYGYRDAGKDYELVTLRSIATVRRDMRSDVRWGDDRVLNLSPDHSRQCYFGDTHGLLKTPVIARDALSSDPRLGPFIVQEYDTNVVIPPGCSAILDERGNINVTVGG